MGIRSIIEKIRERIRKTAGGIRPSPGKIPETLWTLFEAAEKFLRKRKKLFLPGAACLFVILASCIFGLLFTVRGGQKSPAGGDLAEIFQERPLDPGEIFWPDEPDFVPKVELQREGRTSWKPEDAEPYWIDLNKDYGEQWRERIGSVMDEMMEKVP